MFRERDELRRQWLNRVLPTAAFDMVAASEDASFRRYFRVRYANASHIVMDAPPIQEDCGPFVRIAGALDALGLHVPRVLAANLEQGFLLLTDLGDRQYLTELSDSTAQRLYSDALDALLRLQIGGDPATALLPSYDHALLHREMELFRAWFLDKHLELALTEAENRVLGATFDILSKNALRQPRVWVHRDYHARNLMITESTNPGVLDFQDAVIGPVTYDLVSLLRDCYVAWPREQVEAWALSHFEQLHDRRLAGLGDEAQFLRWFDLMGVQRHLKAIGIFARLRIRDGKPGYLKDIPRTLAYVLEVAARYPELSQLSNLLQERITPVLRGAETEA
jgi:aminoglycoside/choline kinase family phosphotransferase